MIKNRKWMYGKIKAYTNHNCFRPNRVIVSFHNCPSFEEQEHLFNDCLTDYLLVNSTGNMSAEARVLSTAMLHQLGLNKDVLRLIPWLGVAQSDQGDLPKTTLGLILEGLQGLAVSITEMLYEGLVALGNFLESIASVISDWGQSLLGKLKDAANAIKDAAEKVGQALNAIISWLIEIIKEKVNELLLPLISPIMEAISDWANGIKDVIINYLATGSGARSGSRQGPIEDFSTLFFQALFSGTAFYLMASLAIAICAIEGYATAQSAGTGVVSAILGKTVGEMIKQMIISTVIIGFTGAVGTAVTITALLYLILPDDDPFWLEGIGLALLSLASVVPGLVLKWTFGKGLGKDISGLILAFFSLFFSIESRNLDFSEYEVVGGTANWISFLLAIIGAAMTAEHDYILDIPINPLRDLEEIVSLIALGYSACAILQNL